MTRRGREFITARAVVGGAVHTHATVVLAAALLLAAGGCSRKATLMQRTSDTTTVGAADSGEVVLREVSATWDDPSHDDASANLTLRALRDDLSRHPPSEWSGRAEELMDSLGVGVETAGSGAALAVNIFVRSDPTRGSWPGLYWRDGDLTRWQPIEGRGMRLTAFAANPGSDSTKTAGLTAVAAVFSRTRTTRQEPLLFTWQRKPKESRWHVAQTLGPDSLGGYGGAAFETAADSVDLVARTYHTPHGFDECATCPHALEQHRFRWRADGFDRIQDQSVPSVYATFVKFVNALQSDPGAASALASNPSVVAQANQFEWNHSKGTWRIAPATEDTGNELTFFRGGSEAYKVEFEPRGDDWVIRSIQSVARTVE